MMSHENLSVIWWFGDPIITAKVLFSLPVHDFGKTLTVDEQWLRQKAMLKIIPAWCRLMMEESTDFEEGRFIRRWGRLMRKNPQIAQMTQIENREIHPQIGQITPMLS
jgi:hypothetical protein